MICLDNYHIILNICEEKIDENSITRGYFERKIEEIQDLLEIYPLDYKYRKNNEKKTTTWFNVRYSLDLFHNLKHIQLTKKVMVGHLQMLYAQINTEYGISPSQFRTKYVKNNLLNRPNPTYTEEIKELMKINRDKELR